MEDKESEAAVKLLQPYVEKIREDDMERSKDKEMGIKPWKRLSFKDRERCAI